ncbi:outer membrane protein [Daejeonella rubra]|uniref:Outer membrane protein n=1 Tax=Daejeonella rubra TaxID=990371 RepID=A0A1G9TIS9_9SPHI|nr:TolC family protein [Daejeonella rubra]SDM47384.1 outer membrane protein [Daejeonella rubra]
MKHIKRQYFFRYTVFTLLLVAISALSLTAQERITLKRATELVIENNLQIKQAQFSEAISEENLQQSKLALYPTLNANTNLNFNFGRSIDPLTNQFVNQAITSTSGNVSSGAALFQGFQKINQISQNKLQLDADKSNTQKIKNDLVLAVVTNYLSVLNAQDLLLASQQQLAISNQQLDIEQKFFDVGNKTLADLSQAKSQVASAELNVTNAQNQVDLAFLNLAQLLELDPSSVFEVEKPQIEDMSKVNSAYSAVDVFKSASSSFPDIRLAELRKQASEKGIEIARGNYFPSLNLQSGFGTRYSNGSFGNTSFSTQVKDNFNQFIGFGLSIPIFNGLAARSSVRRAKINFQNSVINEQLAKNNLNKVINQAVYDLRAAEKRYYSAQSAFQSSKEAFNVIEQRYTVGLVNSLDYNQAQTNLNKAQFDQIQARYDFIFRSKVIDYYLGNPITF